MFYRVCLSVGIFGACTAFVVLWLARRSVEGRVLDGAGPRAAARLERSAPEDVPSASIPSRRVQRGDSGAPGSQVRSTQIGESSLDSTGDGSLENRLLRAKRELEEQIDGAIDGAIDIDHLLEEVQALAELPVDPRVDLDYDDPDTVAFDILGLPDGLKGHFLVGRGSLLRNDRRFKVVEMELLLGEDEGPEFFRDSWRTGPRLHLSIDYDGEGTPGSMALLLERQVDFEASQEYGIDPWTGVYTIGATYRVNLAGARYREPVGGVESCFSETYGLVGGVLSRGERFPGVSPLRGDTDVDVERVRRLLDTLLEHRRAVSGSLKESR